jgi:hypothetical protein
MALLHKYLKLLRGKDCQLKLEIRLKERKGKYPDRGNQRDLRKGNHRIVIKLLF